MPARLQIDRLLYPVIQCGKGPAHVHLSASLPAPSLSIASTSVGVEEGGHAAVTAEDTLFRALDDGGDGQEAEDPVEGLVVQLGQRRLRHVRVQKEVAAGVLEAVLPIDLQHL